MAEPEEVGTPPKSHKHKARNILRYRLKDIAESGTAEVNKKKIKEFLDELEVNGKDVQTEVAYALLLSKLSTFTKKPFKNLKKQDIAAFLSKGLKQNDGSAYAVGSMNSYKAELKNFFRWLYSARHDPDVVDWVKYDRKNGKHIDAKALLTKEEILKLIQAAQGARSRACLACHIEGGLRAGETLGIRIGDIERVKHGFDITVNGKTGQRTVPIISAAPYLRKWLSEHPTPKDPAAYLWLNKRKAIPTPIGQSGLSNLIKTTAKRAGITKRIYPHLCRHSRITHLARDGVDRTHREIFAGHSVGSKMSQVYEHLTVGDVRKKIEEVNGITDPNKKKADSILYPRTCNRCQTVNGAHTDWCEECGTPLTVDAALKEQEKAKAAEAQRMGMVFDVVQALTAHKGNRKEAVKTLRKMGYEW